MHILKYVVVVTRLAGGLVIVRRLAGGLVLVRRLAGGLVVVTRLAGGLVDLQERLAVKLLSLLPMGSKYFLFYLFYHIFIN